MLLDLLKTSLGRLRILAFVEGVSFLIILFVTMPLKYAFQYPQPNKFFGMAHGVLFVLYVLAVVQIAFMQNWQYNKIFLALFASIIPFGTFWADQKLFKENK